MNVVVLGAGAVGGYFGGKLAKQGYSVTFLVRQKRYEQLANRGLKVNSISGDFALTPTLAVDTNDIQNPDVVLVGLKNYHLEGALTQIKRLVEKGAKVIPLLNGIQHLETLNEQVGSENVLGGLCYIESTLNEYGDVVHTSAMQDVVFGALHPSQETLANELYDMMLKSGINVTNSKEIISEMWKKYIFLSSLSGITAAMRQPIGMATGDPVTSKFLENLVNEVYSVALAQNVSLPTDTVELTVTKLKGLSASMTSSMHRDLEKGLPLELDSLHGYLLKVGKEKGIPTPSLDAVYALIHPYKKGASISVSK